MHSSRTKSASLFTLLLCTAFLAIAEEKPPLPTALAKRGELILDDNGSQKRGGKIVAKFASGVKLRAAAGAWEKSPDSNSWRSTWAKGMGHTPVASYQGIEGKDFIVEVSFRYGVMTEPWHTQCFRIALDNRPTLTGHIISAWANPNNDFIETGFLLQHIEKTPEKKIIKDLLLDHQAITVEANQWYTAVLEVVGDEALFRMGDHIAYTKAKPISASKNLISLTLGTTWHEIRRVRIWKAKINPQWSKIKTRVLEHRNPFTPAPHNYQPTSK